MIQVIVTCSGGVRGYSNGLFLQSGDVVCLIGVSEAAVVLAVDRVVM